MSQDAFAQQNDLFVSVNEFTGSTSAPRFVGQVDTVQETVSTLFNVPVPPNNSFSFDNVRDLVVDESGNVLLYNGTFTPSLLSGNATDGVVSQLQVPEFSTVNNTTFGGIARDGDFVFLTDQSTGGSPGQGILRIDITDNSSTRFAETIEPLDVNIGPDGVIFALNGSGSPRSSVFRYDSETLALIDSVPVAFSDHRAVAGLADGTFFTANSDGTIFHYNASGDLLNSANVSGNFFSDIDIAPDGQIALGTARGSVVLTTTSLETFQEIDVLQVGLGGAVFVAFGTDFSAVPEPSTGMLMFSLGMMLALRRKK